MRVTAWTTGAWLGLTAVLLCAAAGGCKREEAKIEVDLTTPRSAAMVFTRAIENGDPETAKSAAYGAGLEIEWVEAMTRAMTGMRQLVTASQAKFGAEAQSLVAGKQTLQLSGALTDAEVQMTGDRATVVPTGGDGTKIPMKRIDGNWKIDVGMLTRGQDITMVVKQLRAVGEAAPTLAKDVEAGKYKTIRDVRVEITRLVVESMYPGAATRPAVGEPSAAPPADSQPPS